MKKKTLFAAFAVSAAMFLIGAVPVCAANEKYAELHGDTIVIPHELVVDKNATTVHDAKFTFSVDGFRNTDDPDYLFKGPNGASVTESLTYSDEDVEGASAEENSGKKTVKKEVVLDLKNVKFTDVGIYRYVVTQNLETGSHVTWDSNPRYIDIAVVDDGNDKLKVDSVLFRTDPESSPSKTDRFTNSYTANTLTVAMQVDGNQSSQNKFFKFTVKLTKKTGDDPSAITDVTPIKVSGPESGLSSVSSATSYDVEEINAANSITSITCEDLAKGHVFYLRDGQSLVLADIPAGYGYTVTEVREDYQPAVAVSGDTVYDKKTGVHVNDGVLTAYTTVTFTSKRQADISTGVMVAVAVPALLLLTGVVGAGVILSHKRKGRQ